jgi:mannose-1-phosphate guanylyltransferase
MAFHTAVGSAAKIALAGSLVTFGIRPAEPATGYGYIERGEPLAGTNGGYRVARFIEKPDRDTAARFLESGQFSWNSGMFVLGARAYLDELGRFRPDILDATRRAWDKRATDLDFLRLDA